MTAAAAIPGVNSAIASSNAVSPNELFALTDEQILNIEPEASGPAPVAQPILAVRDVSPADTQTAQAGAPAPPEPPPWLAAQMKDRWTADEARELWDGVVQARKEAAAYREVFAKPEEARAVREDARALKELYPGGIEQARAASERARTLEEIDAAFYGGAGKSPEQQSAGRAALAQRMLREDPAAFREMVFAGLRALESAGSAPHQPSSSAAPPPPNVVPGFSPASSQPSSAQIHPQVQDETQVPVGARHAVPVDAAAQNPHLAEYRAFEKSANEELERSVGSAINRALEQALPVAQPILAVRGESRTGTSASSANQTTQTGFISHNSRDGAEKSALQERLGGAIRADVESALKGDAQLGEQIAQLLSARRFDENTRAQVVRLINDRAQQLVPGAARRVIQDWTQTAFAAHRSRNESAPATGPVAQGASPAASGGTTNARAASSSISAKSAAADRAEKSVDLTSRAAPRTQGRAVDYHKLSDEQILEL
jgi:hypothetical protein